MGMTGTDDQRARRSDARRSIAAIVRSATQLLSERPDASMTEIARAAGVGRVTLYAHFPSREAVIAAAVEQVVGETNAALDDARLDDGPADAAFVRLIGMSWPILDRHRGLHAAAGVLPPSHLRDRHMALVQRLTGLITRGQDDGTFRADLSATWLAAVAFALFHAAAEEVSADRLDVDVAAAVLERTLLATLAGEPAGLRRPLG